MNGLIEIGDKVVLYGFFDGFAHKTDGTTNGLVTLKTGERVEIPLEGIMKKDQIITKEDIISRMKQLFPNNRIDWINGILHEFGDDFGLWKYKAGYEQGKLEGLIEREKVTIPQFVADWIEYCKRHNFTLFRCLDPVDNFEVLVGEDFEGNARKCILWCRSASDKVARAWLDGYEVEKEPKYIVKMKGMQKDCVALKKNKDDGYWYLSDTYPYNSTVNFHTRKELEEAGFGWVFDCRGVEVEEVE